jgi:pantetheine-phosphate adenylyltransferase
MQRLAVFPGSFDPYTKGHQDVVTRSLTMFDRLIIAIGNNVGKKSMYTAQERKVMIESLYEGDARVSVQVYEGLTIDFCKKVHATHIVRGLRSTFDFEYEQVVAQANKSMLPEVETVFLLARPEFSYISSSVVRDVHINGGDVKVFMPDKDIK